MDFAYCGFYCVCFNPNISELPYFGYEGMLAWKEMSGGTVTRKGTVPSLLGREPFCGISDQSIREEVRNEEEA